MASMMRPNTASRLLSLSRTISQRTQSLPCTRFASLCQRNSIALDTQRRLFGSSSARYGEVIIPVPPMAESISEGTLASLPKQIGESIEADEEVASIETDKIDVSVTAPEAGVIVEYFAAEGDTVVVGQALARFVTGDDAKAAGGSASSEAPKQDTKPAEQPKQETKVEEKAAAPVAEAPKTAPTQQAAPKKAEPTPAPAAVATQGQGPARGERAEKMTRMRKTIAARLKQSQDTCASLTTIQEVDMTNLMAWRGKYRDEVAEQHGVRLGYMGAFTKATTLAALEVPQVNAAIDTEKEIITYRDYVDISIAVSAPKGLVTPVLRNTNSLTIVELEREVAAVAKKARDGKLTMDDLEGGNFSISNPGIFGSMFGTPVINYPQAAVFNMNGIQQRVMAINGEAVIRPMMYITLTYDHRLIDGREAVTFLNIVKKYLEDPSRMLLA